MEGFVVGVATGVKPVKTGEVGVMSDATGETNPSGVAGAANRLQPSVKTSAAVNPSSLVFFRFQLDRFKFKFLA